MKFCSGEKIAAAIGKLISEKHQVHTHSIDLTVAKIFAVKKEGDLDFGGSEEKEALVEELEPEKRSPEDTYGWWTLEAGEYIVEYNEKIKIPKTCLGILQPLLRTLEVGVIHPTQMLLPGEEARKTVLMVGKSGFNVKENARISMLMGIEDIG
jgi:deoxycytidine triphosphate deaminase